MLRSYSCPQDIGASVLNGALSTFLAVAVLLFSTSYVFKTLATQFALTVGLGVLHGLVLLPVLLSLLGPAPFASAEPPHKTDSIEIPKVIQEEEESGSAEDGFDENPDLDDTHKSDPEKTEHAESFGVPSEPGTKED